MKPFARDNQFINLLLMGLLLLPFTSFGQYDEEEETPAEKLSEKDSLMSISLSGLEANPNNPLTLKIEAEIDAEIDAEIEAEKEQKEAIKQIETDLKAIKSDFEDVEKDYNNGDISKTEFEQKREKIKEDLQVLNQELTSVTTHSTNDEVVLINQELEKIADVISPPPPPPTTNPPTNPPTDPTTDPTTDPGENGGDNQSGDEESLVHNKITYDKTKDELSFYDKNEGRQIISDYKEEFTKDELENFEAKLEELGFYGKSTSENQMFSQTIPYVIDAFEIGNIGTEHFNDILVDAVNFTSFLIQDLKLFGDDVKASDFETNLFDSEKLGGLLNSQNPYYFEIVEALAKKGAFGDRDDPAIRDAVLNIINSLKDNGVKNSNIKSLFNLTLRDIVFNKLNNGNLSEILPEENRASSLFDIKANQVKGIVAQNIILGSKGVATTNIDLTDQLPKTSTTAPSKPEDWQVFGIGAGKDIIVKGNVSFKNSNNRDPQTGNVLRPQVKDHALAIGALDEIHFHSKTIESDWGLSTDFLEKHLDYSGATQTTVNDQAAFLLQTDRIKMDFEGANLYLGSISKMELVNVDLESGGNLAVASLDELHIVSSNPTDPTKQNTFTVGKNTNPSDRGDNVQLFANERIVADGLRFEGRVDSIYMEARTVDLKNVTFPSGSEVKLASELGGVGANGIGNGKYPTFGIGHREIGRVNFIGNVKYDIIPIANRDSFDALDTLTNGKQPITISAR